MWSAIAYRYLSPNLSRAKVLAAASTFSGGVGAGMERTMLCTSLIPANGFFVLQRLAQGVLLAGFVIWAVCLWQVSKGLSFRLPWAGPLAERLTSRRSSPPARG